MVLERLQEEAERLNADPTATPHWLLPWAHFARFTDERLEWIADRIIATAARGSMGWAETKRALGWEFPDETADQLIAVLIEQQKLDEVDQTGILYSHSGMRFPSEKLMDEIFRARLWRDIREFTGFGRY